MEMMMIQHQQMHQMVMQQMMLAQLPGANRGMNYPAAAVYAEPAQPVVVHRLYDIEIENSFMKMEMEPHILQSMLNQRLQS